MIETHQLRECQWYRPIRHTNCTNSSTREECGGSKLTDSEHHRRQYEGENRIKFEDCLEHYGGSNVGLSDDTDYSTNKNSFVFSRAWQRSTKAASVSASVGV